MACMTKQAAHQPLRHPAKQLGALSRSPEGCSGQPTEKPANDAGSPRPRPKSPPEQAASHRVRPAKTQQTDPKQAAKGRSDNARHRTSAADRPAHHALDKTAQKPSQHSSAWDEGSSDCAQHANEHLARASGPPGQPRQAACQQAAGGTVEPLRNAARRSKDPAEQRPGPRPQGLGRKKNPLHDASKQCARRSPQNAAPTCSRPKQPADECAATLTERTQSARDSPKGTLQSPADERTQSERAHAQSAQRLPQSACQAGPCTARTTHGCGTQASGPAQGTAGEIAAA